MQVLSLAHLAFFVPAAILVAATPGANNLLSLVNGIRSGAGMGRVVTTPAREARVARVSGGVLLATARRGS